MNLLLLEPAELDAAGAAVLSGRRARHVASVLRAAPGDRLRAGVIRGPVGEAEVLGVGEDRVELRLDLSGPPPAPPPVSLVLALPRPKALRRVLETAAALGVARIDLVNAWRVERSYFASPNLQAERLEESLRLGCEQGAHTWVPEVRVHPLLMSFLEGLPVPGGERRILADPRAAAPLEGVFPPGAAQPVWLAVGPEGGWIDRERESLLGLGFQGARLGAQVLRTETAVTALLAQLDLLRRLPAGLYREAP